MKRFRRISQILFLLFFLGLFFLARFPYGTRVPSDLFLRFDPLIGLVTALSSRSLGLLLLPGIFILLLTIPFGRFFCGWICPLGTLIDINDKYFVKKRNISNSFRDKKLRNLKFYILIFILLASLFSVQFVWFFDPIALLTRTFTLTVFPAFVWVVNGLFNILFRVGFLDEPVYWTYDLLQQSVLPLRQPTFNSSILVLLLFLLILIATIISKRFWCRNICPLGALLGLFSKFRILNRYVDSTCNQCGKCLSLCKMNAIEDDYSSHVVECIECADCVDTCKPGSISFRFSKPNDNNKIDLSKRHFLQAGTTGVVGAIVLSTTRQAVSGNAPLRPPGSLDEQDFLDRCIRCQECVKICSSTGGCLQPAVLKAGIEGFWSPVLDFSSGYCEFSCNLCGKICPTGAIQNLSLKEKQKIKMGTAYFNKDICIPWYNLKDCLVCEEHCPLPEKAIKFDIKEVEKPDGSLATVKFPYVNQDLCTGCGICENKCPLVGTKGIYVTVLQQGPESFI